MPRPKKIRVDSIDAALTYSRQHPRAGRKWRYTPYAVVYGKVFQASSVAGVHRKVDRYGEDRNLRAQSYVVIPCYTEV